MLFTVLWTPVILAATSMQQSEDVSVVADPTGNYRSHEDLRNAYPAGPELLRRLDALEERLDAAAARSTEAAQELTMSCGPFNVRPSGQSVARLSEAALSQASGRLAAAGTPAELAEQFEPTEGWLS